MVIESIEEFFEEAEKRIWNTEKIFRAVDEWDEDVGCALFFKLDAGEPPVVTSPISSDWDEDYYTHWMPLPKEISLNSDYRIACLKSGIKTSVK